jgi:DNA-directed RNA polymerase subunit RPC12/RpoP
VPGILTKTLILAKISVIKNNIPTLCYTTKEGYQINQMKYRCTNCGAVFDINPASIPDKGAYATCGKCKVRFFLKKESGLEPTDGVRKSVKLRGLKKRVPLLATGLVALLVLCGVGYYLFQSSELYNRRRIANNFLEALKTKALTEDNAWDVLEKYVIDFNSLIRKDENGLPKQNIFFPIGLIDYKFKSEEVISKGFVRLAPDEKKTARPRVRETWGGASSFEGINGIFIQSNSEGKLFVIKGLVTNKLPEARKSIPIMATLKNQHGVVLRKKTVYAGITFTEEKIKEKSLNEIDKVLHNEPHERDINPGQAVPFILIFGNLPRDMSEYTVDAISPFAEPEEKAVRTAGKTFKALKKEIGAKNPKHLKIDEKNRVITYYDDEPLRYKLHYLLTLTSRQGKTLKRNGYVTLNIGWEYYEIIEFKWE